MTNPPRPGSASADPGGRTDGLHGFKRRSEEWLRPLEPPAACGIMARPPVGDRPNVSLIWRQQPDRKPGSTFDRNRNGVALARTKR